MFHSQEKDYKKDVKLLKIKMDSVRYILMLSVIGSIVSTYLVQEHFETQKSICDVSSKISCSAINKSVFSELFGVPIALFGVLWYLVLFVMSWKIYEEDRDLNIWITLQFLWTISGMFFVFYLIVAEIIVGALCPFCTIVHIICTVQFILSYRIWKVQNTFPPIWSMISTLGNWIPIFGVLFLFPIFYFNIPGPSNPLNQSLDSFSKCLTNNGVIMFGSDSCGFCMHQKKLFGDSFQYVKYVNCGDSLYSNDCAEKNILLKLFKLE